MKTPAERNNLDLLELVCELHSRTAIYPNDKEMHDAYFEARCEMELRLHASLEVLIILQKRLETLINLTPTGDKRNQLTEENITTLLIIKNAK